MNVIKQPNFIIFGKNSINEFNFPADCLVITSKGAKKRGWLDFFKLKNYYIYDKVEPNPSIEIINEIISDFRDSNFSHVIGLGGGSSLDVAKFVAFKLKKFKILIPTTFGSGSEVTRISVLKVNGKKQSFHDDGLFADVAIIDPQFLENSSQDVIKNSAIDALAQCSEAYDSKLSNNYTKFLCKKAFDVLENGIVNEKYEDLATGSLYCGLGFGNSSTTLGHALSYVFSNEGISHGHALAFTTTAAHEFNNSIFYNRFYKIVKKLNFKRISLKQNITEAAELILTDRKHLDNNPQQISKDDIVLLLKKINDGTVFIKKNE
jgi:succinate semialdehyde reductase